MAIRVAVRRHGILIAVQQLRDTAHGCQENVRQFHAARIFVFDDIGDTCHVMVAEESEQFIHIRVHIIHGHRVIYTCQAVAPTRTVVL